jgi:prepilin-type N-terminal cleavage/methylation domain-containing protein
MPISVTGTSNKQEPALRPRSAAQASLAGFTLVELLVVITLLALFSAISFPLLMNQGDGGERRMLRRLAGTVKQLYNEATLTRDEYLLTFDLDANSISAFRLRSTEDRIEKEPFGGETSLTPLTLHQVDVVGQGSFRSGRVSVKIFPLGWMEQTRIQLQNEAGEPVSLDFSPLTGTVKIDHGVQLTQR